MIEYDFHIALENAIKTKWGYEIRFPESAVLYLRHTENTPNKLQMKITFPQNASITYSVPVIKSQQYSEEDIIGKQLYFLIPYCILKYEHMKHEESLEKISRGYQVLYQGMIDAIDAGVLNAYDMSNIVDLTNKLVDYLFDENQKAKQEVNAVMRGEILETYADRMIAMGREQGLLEGERRGLLEGERKGLLEGERRGKVELLYEMKFSIAKIAEKLCISEEQVRDILRRD